MVSEMTLHFGYGSNLWFEQMNKRCPENIRKGKGILKNYKWIIAERPGGGAANIIESQGDFVEGYVFILNQKDEASLDKDEGVGKSGRYIKNYLEIEMDGITESNVMTYVDTNNVHDATEETRLQVNKKPYWCKVECECTYGSRINKGIRDSGLSEEYVQKYIRKFIDD